MTTLDPYAGKRRLPFWWCGRIWMRGFGQWSTIRAKVRYEPVTLCNRWRGHRGDHEHR